MEKSLNLKPLSGQLTQRPHVVVKAAPYSGTKGITYTLKSLGRVVGHERIHFHGISSWQTTHLSRQEWVDIGFDRNVTILHQVRHPLIVVSSLMTCGDLPWKIQRGIIEKYNLPVKMSEDKIEQGMVFWFWWNKMAELDADYTYKIESLDAEWGSFLAALDLSDKPFPYHLTTIHRKGGKRVFSWNDLYNVNPYLTLDMLDLAASYGYTQVPYHYLRDSYYKFSKRIHLTRGKTSCP